MTAYQNFSDAEIETLLQQLNAPQSLEENIVATLKNSRRTGLFQIKLLMHFILGFLCRKEIKNMAFVALMQSGKSAAIGFIAIMSCSQMVVNEYLSVYKSF